MKRQRRPIRKIKVPKACQFCNGKFEPDYKVISSLERYTSDRGKILGKDRTGICRKHQDRLATAIKRARHLALMPFTPIA
ncbi:30S ribosomal protein S18 [Candidatus Collierbacteria bacterium]|nr:30S ribosomal protein S18 [Candidatus Collierbacteria bacterium]